jgi:uncharacterized membrane protein YtjA (UPF0391 family)
VLIFLTMLMLVAAIIGIIGFAGLVGTATGITKIVLFFFLGLFVILTILLFHTFFQAHYARKDLGLRKVSQDL